MALNTLIHVSQDERERAINRSRRMYQTDLESNLNTSREIGLLEGMEKGMEKGRAEGEKLRTIAIAQNMLDIGLPVEQIERVTGLAREEIEHLKKSL
jgi:predicted transposase/invertase (TIGR01784 family)